MRQVNSKLIENLQEFRQRSSCVWILWREDDRGFAGFTTRVRFHDVGTSSFEFRLGNKANETASNEFYTRLMTKLDMKCNNILS